MAIKSRRRPQPPGAPPAEAAMEQADGGRSASAQAEAASSEGRRSEMRRRATSAAASASRSAPCARIVAKAHSTFAHAWPEGAVAAPCQGCTPDDEAALAVSGMWCMARVAQAQRQFATPCGELSGTLRAASSPKVQAKSASSLRAVANAHRTIETPCASKSEARARKVCGSELPVLRSVETSRSRARSRASDHATRASWRGLSSARCWSRTARARPPWVPNVGQGPEQG
mmetsp:Transcript_147017/g.469827  ORF Transcript_147017/g.469827 Transcript_147017/m.469827 type:complete len:230 (+) Transcript_147017:1014-1703(+)